MLEIGPYTLPNRLVLAPMAGVTDRAFRMLCRQLGAGHAVSEMLSAQPGLRDTAKSLRRRDHRGEPGPIALQIAGTEPAVMADAARHAIDQGAQIVDINMGCPAKKVCQVWAGSALMRNPPLAVAIVEAVVRACAPHGVPVTLKMRSGWDDRERNAVALCRAAAASGVAAVTIHGRTRAQGFRGEAEYATVAAVKAALDIPVIANGDIDSPTKAAAVLRATGADGLMLGRAVMGRPWLFAEVQHHLATGGLLPAPQTRQVQAWLTAHLQQHYALYGEDAGVRSARKHIGWAVRRLPGGEDFRSAMNLLNDGRSQLAAVSGFFEALAEQYPSLPIAAAEAANEARLLREA